MQTHTNFDHASPLAAFLLGLLTLATNGFSAPSPDKPSSISDSLLAEFLAGPMRGVEEIVFAARGVNQTDGHWYANFGYYAADPKRKAYGIGGKLYRLNLRTRQLTTLLADPQGGVRDPQVSYDGRKVLFSYRPGGTEHYHLYELDLEAARAAGTRNTEHGTTADATPHSALRTPHLKQLTAGPYDDLEPTYLPDGDIIFVSSRCKRWVNCWLTQVAVLHRCDANGSNIRALSSNNEHDNTPWPLADGRVLYTRWEYVDRSQVHFHHLWAMNPDGTAQMTWYGNLHPGITMIDAKPIPGSDKIVASFSPGHGQREHDGVVTVIDPRGGPDAKESAKSINKAANFRDPWAFSEDCFLAASRDTLVVMDSSGRTEEILKLPAEDLAAKLQCHEPRPVAPRPRERILQARIKPDRDAGYFLLADVNHGRNMRDVKHGEIKKLLVLETLPMPIHYTGGMEPISYGGTFTLERILGTVPVEDDGSAYFEVPAQRSVFFVALDEHDLSVKRMQSFVTAQPGETTSCVGCHEHRAQTPQVGFHATRAARRTPSKIEPIRDVPDVFDFPRDVQPILDALCVDCHGYEKTARGGPRAGRLILTGDHGPLFSHSYYMLTIGRLFADGRNQPKSNYAPRTLGSSASRLLTLLDGSHYDVKATPHQKRMLRLWIESAAAYPGTYAALATGMIGNYDENRQVNTGDDWPATKAAAEVFQQRCVSCHDKPSRLLPQSLADERGVSFWEPSLDDPRLNTSRHIVFNLSRPEKSLILLAPLAKEAGGWGLCRKPALSDSRPERGLQAASASSSPRVENVPNASDDSSVKRPEGRAPEAAVFADTSDPGYQKLLALCVAGKNFLETDKRFDMAGFKPRVDWLREMKRYGVLPESATLNDPIEVYAVERAYWESLWYKPPVALVSRDSQGGASLK
ncbi:MAG: hypothetical protein HYY24_24000 [Verrucomicrobia bacterium]|nr:hypothetical protein [Verrucomicrobiota bacterium]